MNQPRGVRGGQTSSGGDENLSDLAPGTRRRRQPRGQRLACDQLHRQEDPLIDLSGVVHHHDVGVRQAGDRLGLAQKTLLRAGDAAVERWALVQDLESNPTVELSIVCGVDLAHAAAPDQFQHDVTPEQRALGKLGFNGAIARERGSKSRPSPRRLGDQIGAEGTADDVAGRLRMSRNVHPSVDERQHRLGVETAQARAITQLTTSIPHLGDTVSFMPETGRLAPLFYEAFSSSQDHEAPRRDESDLEAELAEVCARARATGDGIALSDHDFVLNLGRVMARSGIGGAHISQLPIEDLYLTCACLLQAPRALAVLENRHGSTIRKAIARMIASSDEVDEIEQGLLVNLVIGSVGAAPLIRSYRGQAPLDRWLRVVAHRTALSWLRQRQSEARAHEGAAIQPVLSGDTPPEVQLLREQHHQVFSVALKEGLDTLSERARLILRWYFVDGVTVERIGTMFKVSQPTVSRWLADARDTLYISVKTRLRQRLGESTGEIAQLAGLVASRLDLSLSAVLKAQ